MGEQRGRRPRPSRRRRPGRAGNISTGLIDSAGRALIESARNNAASWWSPGPASGPGAERMRCGPGRGPVGATIRCASHAEPGKLAHGDRHAPHHSHRRGLRGRRAGRRRASHPAARYADRGVHRSRPARAGRLPLAGRSPGLASGRARCAAGGASLGDPGQPQRRAADR